MARSFYEEYFVIERTLIEKTLDMTFKRGRYAFRTRGMKDGPSMSPSGCAVVVGHYGTNKKGKVYATLEKSSIPQETFQFRD